VRPNKNCKNGIRIPAAVIGQPAVRVTIPIWMNAGTETKAATDANSLARLAKKESDPRY